MQPDSKGDEVHAAEGTLAFHCVKHHNISSSTDYTSNLKNERFRYCEIARKLTSTRRKMEAIIRGVISHHATETVKASTANTPFCGVATDANSHLATKTLPVLIQYFDWRKGAFKTKLLDVPSKPNGKSQTIAQYYTSTEMCTE